jgi:hypothetical protein
MRTLTVMAPGGIDVLFQIERLALKADSGSSFAPRLYLKPSMPDIEQVLGFGLTLASSEELPGGFAGYGQSEVNLQRLAEAVKLIRDCRL